MDSGSREVEVKRMQVNVDLEGQEQEWMTDSERNKNVRQKKVTDTQN